MSFLLFPSVAPAQQASLTLRDCDVALCQNNDTEWSIQKTADTSGLVDGSGPVVWTITVDRGATSENWLLVNGVITIANTGSANATIGNIVINLQRPAAKNLQHVPWVSAAADMADATSGDAATLARMVASASAENAVVNAAQGAANYTVSGAQGTFVETAGSGPLEFTDALSNTAFSLVPQPVIPPGEQITLLYTAQFNNSVLGLSALSPVRVEALVTFGNAGARGGSGASAADIDINGNGTIDADEGPAPVKVRTVPCRETRTVPALEQCNDVVQLSDLESDVVGTGSITFDGFQTDIGGGSGVELVDDSATRTVSIEVHCDGTAEGTLVNTAHLDGESSNVLVRGPQIGVDGDGNPIYSQYEFPCCVGVDLDAASNVSTSCTDGFDDTSFCSFTQGGWGSRPRGDNPGALLRDNFSIVYPPISFVEVGIPGAAGRSMRFTSAAAIEAYLPTGGPAGALTGDLINPTLSSSGVFGGQVLALQLNVDFSAAGVTQGSGGPFGDLVVCSLGLTVSQVLADANTALGGGGLPSYAASFSALNELVTRLNESFDNCIPSDWAQANLCR